MQPTGLLLRPNPRQGGQERQLILELLSPCSSKSHQPLSGPCGKTPLVQNPMASDKTPASLHRPACNRPVRWEPLSLGISKVFTPSQGPTTCAQTKHSSSTVPAWHQDRIYQTASASGECPVPPRDKLLQTLDGLFRRVSEQRPLPHQGSLVCWTRRGWGQG